MATQTGDQIKSSTSRPHPTFPVQVVEPSQPLSSPGLAFAKTNTYSSHSLSRAAAETTPQRTAMPASYPSIMPGFSRQDADLEPWRYRGYLAMCKWMASDDGFFILRKFGDISARVLLRLQDRIVILEEELQRVDHTCAERGYDNGTFRYDPCLERQQILDELTSRLEQYLRFLLDHAQIKARPAATKFQVSNVRQWFENANEKVIRLEEQRSTDRDGDLITLVSKVKTLLHRFIDRFEKPRLWALFRDRDINRRLHGSTGDFGLETTVYTKEPVVATVMIAMVMLVIVAMLVGLVWWLQHLSAENSMDARFAVIAGCLVAFAMKLKVLSGARSLEVVATAAACGLVLLVLIQVTS